MRHGDTLLQPVISNFAEPQRKRNPCKKQSCNLLLQLFCDLYVILDPSMRLDMLDGFPVDDKSSCCIIYWKESCLRVLDVLFLHTHAGCRTLPSNCYPRTAKCFPGLSNSTIPKGKKTKTGEGLLDFLKVTEESCGRSKNRSGISWPLAVCSQTAPDCNLACY